MSLLLDGGALGREPAHSALLVRWRSHLHSLYVSAELACLESCDKQSQLDDAAYLPILRM